MTTREELLALAERVEAATGACALLDAEIEVLLRRPIYPDAAVVRMGNCPAAAAIKGIGRGWRRYGIFFQHHRYTASLDAAMTLVPDGSLFTVRTLWDRDKVAGFASISRYETAGPDDQLRRYWVDEQQANAATPTIALCTAALRARAAQIGGAA